MEPARRVQQDIRCAGCQGWEAGSVDDRCDPSEGPSDGSQLAQKGDVPRRIGRTKGGLNSKLHAVCDGHGRPLIRSEEHTSELQSLMRTSYAVLRLKKKTN